MAYEHDGAAYWFEHETPYDNQVAPDNYFPFNNRPSYDGDTPIPSDYTIDELIGDSEPDYIEDSSAPFSERISPVYPRTPSLPRTNPNHDNNSLSDTDTSSDSDAVIYSSDGKSVSISRHSTNSDFLVHSDSNSIFSDSFISDSFNSSSVSDTSNSVPRFEGLFSNFKISYILLIFAICGVISFIKKRGRKN